MGNPKAMGALKALSWGSGVFALGLYFYLVARSCGPESLGAGRAGIPRADRQRIDTQGSAALGSPSAPDTHTSAAGAISSPSGFSEPPLAVASNGDQAGMVDPEGVSYDAITASRIAERYDEAPEESILWGTVDIWSDPAFQEFVGDRVSSYPTAEDARLALESPAVQRAYFDFVVADAIAVEFELSPDAPRDLVENAKRAYETAEVDLWRALDKGSAYREWETLGMLWRSYDDP